MNTETFLKNIRLYAQAIKHNRKEAMELLSSMSEELDRLYALDRQMPELDCEDGFCRVKTPEDIEKEKEEGRVWFQAI